jgi:lipopolysaccharide export system permease protein
LLGAALQLPAHIYELGPIAVLIGTIFSLARLAQSSEFTILRTSGLSPARALGLLALLGVVFGLVTFVVGDYLVPLGERQNVLLRARFNGGIKFSDNGAWLKEHRNTAQGERSFSVNINGSTAGGNLSGIRIFEFDADSRLISRIQADEASVADDGTWTLSHAQLARWPLSRNADDASVQLETQPTLAWPSTLTPRVVSAAVLPLGTMTTVELWRYSAHLNDQEQAVQQHEILFWRKALYPLACIVMVALALPFAYLRTRAGSVSIKVFGGIMLGISFILLNNLSGHIGLLRGWVPWVAAASPSLMYLLLSMGAFMWLVRYR